MKTFILTIDYELFLGTETGTVNQCMIEPTYKLAELLDINNSRMTVFWDILHYYQLSRFENKFSQLKIDKELIEEQILFLAKKGHDIQLHLHPHWLDAEYTNGSWNFKYDRFKIQSLSDYDDPENIETISGCITITKKIMEELIRKQIKDYKVTSFRAGGYLVEPFGKIMKALEYNKIYIDSSVLPGMKNNNPVNGYDFRNHRISNMYNFQESTATNNKNGKFTEVPITTFRLPAYRNILYTILRKLKYGNLESGRTGTGSGESIVKFKNSNLKKLISLLKPKYLELTTDSNFAERFNYMYKKAANNSTMILHPKLSNEHTLDLLKEKLLNKDIRFISLKDLRNDE